MEFFRFLFLWIHLERRCSRTQLSQTTCQRRTRAQSGRSTGQSPAPQLRQIPVGAGSARPPVSSLKRSTGEASAVWLPEIQWHKDVSKDVCNLQAHLCVKYSPFISIAPNYLNEIMHTWKISCFWVCEGFFLLILLHVNIFLDPSL